MVLSLIPEMKDGRKVVIQNWWALDAGLTAENLLFSSSIFDPLLADFL